MHNKIILKSKMHQNLIAKISWPFSLLTLKQIEAYEFLNASDNLGKKMRS